MTWLTAIPAVIVLAIAGPTSPEEAAQEALVPDDLKPGTDEEQVADVVKLFVDTLQDTKADLLAEMGTDPFTFDGNRVAGRKAIRDEWKAVFKRLGQSIKRAGKPAVELLDYAKAKARFGPPPKKFDHLKPEKCWYAAVSFPKRAGLMLILSKDEKAGWLVTGVTD